MILLTKFFPAPGASVETEDEGLGRLVAMLEVPSEVPDNVVDDQMLTMELISQVGLQSYIAKQ